MRFCSDIAVQYRCTIQYERYIASYHVSDAFVRSTAQPRVCLQAHAPAMTAKFAPRRMPQAWTAANHSHMRHVSRAAGTGVLVHTRLGVRTRTRSITMRSGENNLTALAIEAADVNTCTRQASHGGARLALVELSSVLFAADCASAGGGSTGQCWLCSVAIANAVLQHILAAWTGTYLKVNTTGLWR